MVGMSVKLLFSTIEVTRQAFYNSSLCYAIVNLKPIVPGRERPFFSPVLSLWENSPLQMFLSFRQDLFHDLWT